MPAKSEHSALRPDNVIGTTVLPIAPAQHLTIMQQVVLADVPMSEKTTLPPFRIKRGFNRIEAAAYIGISPTKFDQLVGDGRLPKAKQIDGRKVWDVRELDPAFEELGSIDTSWDDVA